jgi:hypothetical protein
MSNVPYGLGNLVVGSVGQVSLTFDIGRLTFDFWGIGIDVNEADGLKRKPTPESGLCLVTEPPQVDSAKLGSPSRKNVSKRLEVGLGRGELSAVSMTSD